jgi:putative flippase GtrA
MRKLASQFARFGLVGAGGFVLDFAVFNLLRATLLNPDTVHEGPVIAKIISTAVAIVFNWIGNRHWTFREHRGPQLVREGIQFGIVSVGGMLIGLGCLFVSHYVLGYTSVLADNISSNVIGLGLGTLFRFTFYRLWVFAPHRGETAPAVFEEDDEADAATALPTPSSRQDPAGHPPATAPADAAPRSG